MYFDTVDEAAEFISETYTLAYEFAVNFVLEESCDIDDRAGFVLSPAMLVARFDY